jgi:hypothetical protein
MEEKYSLVDSIGHGNASTPRRRIFNPRFRSGSSSRWRGLLPAVIIWLVFRALQAEFVLDIDQSGSFVKKLVCSPATKDITALPK